MIAITASHPVVAVLAVLLALAGIVLAYIAIVWTAQEEEAKGCPECGSRQARHLWDDLYYCGDPACAAPYFLAAGRAIPATAARLHRLKRSVDRRRIIGYADPAHHAETARQIEAALRWVREHEK